MYLILGSLGYVGSHFFDYLSSLGQEVLGLSREDFDYTDERKLVSFLKEKQPKFVINAAGYTGKPNVDACESDKAECLFGNAVLPGTYSNCM
jgi:dTDP-4-dehydrorhamnose reductase